MKPFIGLVLSIGLAALWSGCAKPPSPPADTAGTPASAPAVSDVSPAQAGKKIVLAMIPKLKGIAYFNACEKGAREAAEELGNVELLYDGPLVGSEEGQNEMIDAFITQGVDVLALAANDPVAVAPYLKKARDQGIRVLTFDADADAEKSGREVFVNQARSEDVAQTLVDVMAEEAGENAKTALISSTETAPNQAEWTRHMKDYMARKYPQMKLLVTKYPGEDLQKALQMTQDVLKAYPEVQGIWGLSSVAFPGAADAVKKAGLSGKVVVTGLSTPNDMREFVQEGTVKTVVLWNAVDLGYLTVHVARALVDGSLAAGETPRSFGRLKNISVEGDEVVLGPPVRFTAENIDEYDF